MHAVVWAQDPFNRTKEHRVGVGVSITSFSANVNYLLIPSYGFKIGKHLIGVDGFYGRLDNLPERSDWGIGLVYRAYPFKNKTWTRPLFETALYYHNGADSRYTTESLFWRIGGGVEAALTEVIHIDIAVNFALDHPVGSTPAEDSDPLIVAVPNTRVFFMPLIRVSFALGRSIRKK